MYQNCGFCLAEKERFELSNRFTGYTISNLYLQIQKAPRSRCFLLVRSDVFFLALVFYIDLHVAAVNVSVDGGDVFIVMYGVYATVKCARCVCYPCKIV